MLALGGWLALHHEITLGTFLAFSTYIAQLMAPARQLAGVLTIGQQARAGIERIFQLLDLPPAIADPPEALELPELRGEITFSDVALRLRRGPPVLGGFDLHIAAGERVAIVGPSGSGKSTVAMLVSRFYDPDGGAVLVDGHDVREVTLPLAAPPGRSRLRRELPVLRRRAGQHRLRAARRRPTTRSRPRPGCAQAHEFIDGASPRLRHRRGRARPDPLGRAAPADRPRPGHPLRARGSSSSTTPRAPSTPRTKEPIHDALRERHGRPDDAARRPPPLHPAPGRPHRRHGPRPRGRRGDPRRAARPQRRLPDRSSRGSTRSRPRQAGTASRRWRRPRHARRRTAASAWQRRRPGRRPAPYRACALDRRPEHRAGLGGGGGGGGGGWRLNLAPTPELLGPGGRAPARARLPHRRPARRVAPRPQLQPRAACSVSSAGRCSSGSSSSSSTPWPPWPGPILVKTGIDSGVSTAPRRCSSSLPPSTSSSPWPTSSTRSARPSSPAGRRSGSCCRCASASGPSCSDSRSTTTSGRWQGGS